MNRYNRNLGLLLLGNINFIRSFIPSAKVNKVKAVYPYCIGSLYGLYGYVANYKRATKRYENTVYIPVGLCTTVDVITINDVNNILFILENFLSI